MTGFAARALWARKLRTALTAIAIVLGVAMVSGTFVLTDSIDQAFDRIFTDSRKGSGAVITGKSAFDLSHEGGFQAPPFDEALLDEVRQVSSVGVAEGSVLGQAQIIGRDGKAVVVGGAPNLGFSIDPENTTFNPLTLVEGTWPRANEVAIDAATADRENYKIGDTVGVQAEGPVERLRMSGIVRFGSVSTIGGATLAGFDLPTAQRLFDKEGKLDEIALAPKPGTSNEQLVSDVENVLPEGTQVRTGSEQAEEDAAGTDEFINILRIFLLVFGGVALFVGAFVIANSLSITVAQRTREFATLRTLGGSRRQILRVIFLESLIVGLIASVIGLFVGLGLGKLLFWLFDVVGFTLPNTGLVLETRTVVAALLVGIVVTLLASLLPGLRATRVPPIAAVREGVQLPESRFFERNLKAAGIAALATVVLLLPIRVPYVGLVLAVGAAVFAFVTVAKLIGSRTVTLLLLIGAGGAVLVIALFVPHSTRTLLVMLGIGALLIFIGVALFAARIVKPLAEGVSPVATGMVTVFTTVFYPVLLGYWLLRYGLFERRRSWPRRLGAFAAGAVLVVITIPLVLPVVLLMRLFAAFGWVRPEWPVERPGVLADAVARDLARENAQRNPARTASTAAALMIGLALVTLVAILGAGIRSTFNDAVDSLARGEFYAITAQNNFSPIPIAASEAAAKAPGVQSVTSVRAGEAQIFGDAQFLTAATPNLGDVITLDWEQGSPAVFRQLGVDGAFVDEGFADNHNLRVGSPVEVLTPKGARLRLRVRGVFDPPPGGSPFGPVTISSATFDRNYENPQNLYSFVKMSGGVTDANQHALERTLASFPNAKVADGEEFKDNQAAGLSAAINILYVLLALSVIVSFFGIVNTLVLTVFERTRELGMLRAIGMTRRQVRRMIRHESVVTALIGAALGIVLGIVFGALIVARVDLIEFTLPVRSLIVFGIAAILVGIVAAILPARRASRLNVLEALQYE